MAKTKTQTNTDEKFVDQDFNLFEALAALDKKDYYYYDNLTNEQQKKFIPYMMILWMSMAKGTKDLSYYYLVNTNFSANKYFFHENISKHPKLQWQMLCTISPGLGKQFHQYIPHIRERVSKLLEPAKVKEITDYYTKIYPKADKNDIKELSEVFANQQKRKFYFAEKFKYLKLSDIEVLNEIITDDEIKEYEKEYGNDTI
jgi:hypothetical protein